MSASQPAYFHLQEFSDGGVLLLGGRLYTYDQGTTTLKTAYTDAAGAIPQTYTADGLGGQYIALNARGELPAPLYLATGSYDIALKRADGSTVWTRRADPIGDGVTALGGPSGSSLIGFLQAGSNTVLRTVQDKLREIPSLNDFAGATDDARFAAAKANGTAWLRIPSGVHATAGWSIAETDTLANLVFDPGAQLFVTAAANSIGLDIQKATFNISGVADIKSTGTISDGLNTTGLRCGNPLIVGKAYIRIEATRTQGFSKRGVVFYQPVYVGIERVVSIGDFYGISVEPALGIGGSTVCIGPSYITGSKRGINLSMASWVTLHEPITEYCGDSVTSDGALHFNACGNVTVVDRYGEQNARNMVKIDSSVTFIGGSMFAATAADIVSYVGTADSDRGTAQLNSKSLRIRRINFDDIDNQPLVIGPTLALGGISVPVNGGSVQWANETREMIKGAVVSGVWTAVKTIPIAEQTGAPHQRAMYKFYVVAGFADLPPPVPYTISGTIINGVMYSDTGAIPSWLRLTGNNVIEINLTNATYGLNYEIALSRTGYY